MTAFLSLLRAELLHRRFVFAAAIALGLGGPLVATLALSLVGSPPTGTLLTTGLSTPLWSDLLALFSLAFALWIATDAFPRQRDAGSDRFLAALPVSPPAVFTARVLACGGVVLTAVLVRHGAALAQHMWAGDWPAGLAVRALGLGFTDVFGAFVTLGLAFSVAHWRRLGWILLGVVLLTLRALTSSGILDPGLDLLRFATEVSAGGAVGWLAASVFASGWSYTLFRDARDPLGSLDGVLHRGVVVPRLVTMLLALLAVSVPAVVIGSAVNVSPTHATYPTAAVTTTTRRYRFRYPARLAETLRPLLANADAIYVRVAAELGLEATDDLPPVLVDLDVELGLDALAQLTCAQLLGARTDGRIAAWSRATRTFEVGLCRDVALRVTGEDRFPARFHAAVLHSRRPVRLDELLDWGLLAGSRGEEASQSLGEALVVALRLESADVPRVLDALRSLPPQAAPASLEASRALWVDWLKAAGVAGLGRLEERVLEVIEEGIGEDPRARIALPRLEAIVESADSPTGWRVLAVPDQDVPTGWFVVCRARRSDPARGMGPMGHAPQRLGPDPRGSQAFFVRNGPQESEPWIQLGLRAARALPALGTIWEDWTAPSGTP